MSISLGVALYFIIWWLMLFAVLPFGMKTQDEDGEVVPGTPGSAPAHVRILRSFAITTVVAAVVFGIVYLAIAQKWISFVTPVLPGRA
jgi:predicted secreted protein